MTNIKVDEVLAKYNKEDKDLLVMSMRFLAFAGASGAPKTTEEFEEWCEKTIADEKARIAKKEMAKAKKLANEEKKATDLGMTVEEYREYQNILRNQKRHLNRIAELEKELAEEKRKLNYYNKLLDR